jgi:oxalate decarboxylase/phosphoglucose isomerase-like protein (cupin superfamily)
MNVNKIKGKRFVCVDDVETQIFPWGRLAWLSEPRVTGTDNMTAGVVTLEPGKGHERHNHPKCEEILFVIEGEGDQTVEADDKIEKRRIKKGDLAHIPSGAYHSTINAGTDPMVLFAVYQFPGPEAVLRKSPECKIEPAKNKA